MHPIEKILAKAANKGRVYPGEIVNCKVDLVEINDLYLQVIDSFYEMNGSKVWDPDKVVFVFDHYAPAPTEKSAFNQNQMRKFVSNQSIKHLFEINEGVCHQVMPEAGLVYPGMILVATDSHTTTHGAFGAFGTGVGATDAATILLTGNLWFKVPEIIKIEINGELKKGVMAKDIILHILGQLGSEGAVYQAIEFTGETIKELSIDSRMVLCNMAVEIGAKTAYIHPDRKTIKYLEAMGVNISEIDMPQRDKGYVYRKEYKFNISNLEPQIASPHSVDSVSDIKNIEPKKVDQVYIGSCTGGRLEDIEAVYRVLKGRKVKKGTRCIIIPASNKVYLQAIKKGYVESLIESGITFSAPGCGACMGIHQGVICEDEVCVTTTNRNFPGRMGSTKGDVYLVSPITAATCALTGYITDPREEEFIK